MKLTLAACSLGVCLFATGLSSCSSGPETSSLSAAEGPRVESPVVARAEIKTLEFKIEIAAPVEKVWDTMLDPESYRKWTEPFMSGSYFEGSWSEGERMHFLAPGGSGMVAVIAENRPHELLSIEHIGFVMEGVEDTTSEGVRSWAPAYENYRFAKVPGGTEVTVEHDVHVSFEAFMSDIWPKALAALKALSEAD